MSKFFRTVVMCLIALAIPLQGLAAGIMPLCMPTHHAGGSAASDPPGPSQDHHGAHARMAAKAGDASHHLSVEHAADPAPVGNSTDGTSGHSAHCMVKCCSASCSMAAVVALDAAMPAHARPPAPLHPMAWFHLGVTPGGIDRPPKLFLA